MKIGDQVLVKSDSVVCEHWWGRKGVVTSTELPYFGVTIDSVHLSFKPDEIEEIMDQTIYDFPTNRTPKVVRAQACLIDVINLHSSLTMKGIVECATFP